MAIGRADFLLVECNTLSPVKIGDPSVQVEHDPHLLIYSHILPNHGGFTLNLERCFISPQKRTGLNSSSKNRNMFAKFDHLAKDQVEHKKHT